ncbi:methyltransferase domain-containing protein [Thiohalobacter sp. IOR34]|uniref:class I SAM-dependent methyltransferase n=1 Tax=Thiohalobacter sp. IOR34 TaxID=3057176 RepID=UPI0025B11C8C|nr:methyltransferase domain-containing protein [Thiohalobacter sp. IOR34]WJW75629.1 methyltransferase domain-containing protein [Thiohalobacter sp. IOR34]
MSGPADKWDAIYRAASEEPRPAAVLHDYGHLLPLSGRALDLACGRGGNALYLAARGFEVSAWDVSPVAIGQLRSRAAAGGLALQAEVRDVLAEPPAVRHFDVIVVSRFLERALAPALIAALRPGGLLYYQTYVREAVDDAGPRNPAYRLAPGELLELFAPLRPLLYRDEGRQGDLSQGLRNEAQLVAIRED